MPAPARLRTFTPVCDCLIVAHQPLRRNESMNKSKETGSDSVRELVICYILYVSRKGTVV